MPPKFQKYFFRNCHEKYPSHSHNFYFTSSSFLSVVSADEEQVIECEILTDWGFDLVSSQDLTIHPFQNCQ